MDVDRGRLERILAELAREPRPAESDRLEECRRLVVEEFQSSGWRVERQAFSGITEEGEKLRGANLVAVREEHWNGQGPRLCVGAHLDSRSDSPGADDNASAVAALLEIARLLPERWPESPKLDLELVAFDLEEWGMLGGAAHARLARADDVDLAGMVSLEMLGYCDPAPNSQALPKHLVGLYPDTGDFIAVIGNQNSTRLIEAYRKGLETIEGLPVESLEVPENGNYLQATRLSDHSPFWDEGFAALMITDTSFLRNPHYHLPSDTPETLDYDFLTKVAAGSLEAVRSIVAEGL